MRKPSKILLGPEDGDTSGGLDWEEAMEDAAPKHSLKIFKADQTHRLLKTAQYCFFVYKLDWEQ